MSPGLACAFAVMAAGIALTARSIHKDNEPGGSYFPGLGLVVLSMFIADWLA